MDGKKYRLRHTALLVMMAVILGSCDHDTTHDGGGSGTVPETPVPIAFTALEGEEESVTRAGSTGVTRADRGLDEVLPDGNKTFKVWAYKNTDNGYTSYQIVIPGYTVRWIENSAATSTTNSHGWEYVGQGEDQTIKYWDWSATAYRFFGYCGSGVEATLQPATQDPEPSPERMEFSFTANAANETACPYYSRLWFTDNTYAHYPTREYGQVVRLEFLKPFVKVRFMFISDDQENMPIEDVDIVNPLFKPTDSEAIIKQSGAVTISYPLTGGWEAGAGPKETFSVSGATGIAAFDHYYYEAAVGETDEAILAGEKYWYTVLPATGQGTYTLTVTINGEDQSCVVPANFMDWLPSYQYTYVFKVHADNGVSIGGVYSAFKTWENGGEKERIVFNW